MLTATYTLVALAVEQASMRTKINTFHEMVDSRLAVRPSLSQGEVDDTCHLMQRLYDAVHWRKVEMFLVPRGLGHEVLVNEIAPRVHNSGHWTIEGAFTSQFEQHIRAICGLPPGSTDLACGSARMENLIGEDVKDWERLVGDPHAHVHIYGKGEARPGRKMGHLTCLADSADRALALALETRDALST